MSTGEITLEIQFKQKAIVVAVALAVASPGLAIAQQTQEGQGQKQDGTAQKQEAQVQKVVVTGSNLKRTDTESASPVQVVGRAEIEQGGSQTVAELLNKLTSNDHSAISDLGGANSWASGATGVSLRNLGVSGTLVVLNGRRLSAYGFADGLQANFINIDSIPTDVIDRVEILKDGASAIYGSDAIAGVINIITRRDFQGVGMRASARQSTQASFLGAEQKASITGGTGDLAKDGYNAFAHLEVFHRGGYKDREIRPLLPDWYIRMNPDRDALSTGSFPGNYVGRYPANYRDASLANKSINVAAPGCAPENLNGGLCFYDYWKDSDALSPADRATFYAGGRLQLGQRTAYTELQLASTRDDYHTAILRSNVNGVALSWYDSLKGQMQYFTDPKLPVGHPNNPYDFPIGLNYRFIDHPEIFKNIGSSTQYRALAGIEGSDMGWDWDAAAGVMGSKAQQRQHLYRDRYAYYDAIVSGAYKFGQVNSLDIVLKMFPEMGSHGSYSQVFSDFKASRELMQLDGGPMQLAVGMDLRHESFEHKSSDNVLAAQIVQFSGVSINGARNLAAAFAEVGMPLTKALEANFAVRGDRALGQAGAVVPKAGFKYKALDQLMLRGTFAGGFRAPSIPETGNGGASWFNNGVVDPKRCATATAMRDILNTGNAVDKNNALTAYALGCSASFPAAVTPNPDLKPEKTKSFTLGFVLQPIKQLSLTVDYYNIKRRDEIVTKDPSDILANEDRIPGLVARDPLTSQDLDLAQRVKELSGKSIGFAVGPIKTIAAQYQNVGRSAVAGVDVDVNSRWSLGEWGRLTAGLELNRQLDYRSWDSFENAYTQNYVGYRGTPRTLSVTKLGWDYSKLSTGLRLRWNSGTALAWGELDSSNTVDGCAARGVKAEDCKIAADASIDLWGKLALGASTNLSVNVFNATNRGTPVQMRPGSALPLAGRSAMVTLEHKF